MVSSELYVPLAGTPGNRKGRVHRRTRQAPQGGPRLREPHPEPDAARAGHRPRDHGWKRAERLVAGPPHKAVPGALGRAA